MTTQFFKIFRAGTHRAMNGKTLTFSPQEVSATARYYQPGGKKAPLVLGHPADDAPPLGLVLELHEKGGALFAAADASDALIQLVRDKKCAGVSCAFFAKDDPRNPVPGMWSLKHVGFMTDGMRPSIKDLGVPAFSEPVGDWLEASFSDLQSLAFDVSFSQAPQDTAYQRGREALHRAALNTVAAHPGFTYLEAVTMLERQF